MLPGVERVEFCSHLPTPKVKYKKTSMCVVSRDRRKMGMPLLRDDAILDVM